MDVKPGTRLWGLACATEVAVIRRQRPDNVDAWGCYHQATAALGGNGWNEHAVTKAQDFLRRALELDSNFALARYTPDGALDDSFGTNGVVLTPLAA